MKKMLLYPFLAVFVSFSLGACSEQTVETAIPEEERDVKKKEKQANDASKVHWSYKGETGPKQWGTLDAAYSTCTDGSEQSPINIDFSQVTTSEKANQFEIQYEPSAYSIINNGHTIKADIQNKHSLVIDNKEYILSQFHFHAPSEHKFNGQYHAMELHLVHQAENGELAVLGVMIQEGAENESLRSVWDMLPKEEMDESRTGEKPIELSKLVPKDQTTIHYKGSLTTPPCTENVQWYMMKQPIEMSKEQIQSFKQIFPENHRPVQPLNEREVTVN
ncbi:carbonic anhydrase family protein [Bacillus tianshenii]|nr:carbonic anhydrase family protein [Bacillus tianshenii]